MVLPGPPLSEGPLSNSRRSPELFMNSNFSPMRSRSETENRDGERTLTQAMDSDNSPANPSTARADDGIATMTRTKSIPFQARVRARLSRVTRTRSSRLPANVLELDSTYRTLPLLIGCIVPVSILINVPSLTSPWAGLSQLDPTTGDWSDPIPVDIPGWMDRMVIVALIMAVACNLCVLSRFLERHVYYSVVLSVVAATLQDILSVGVIIPFCLKYPVSDGYVYLEGFWTMIASMIFSLLATVLMSIDFHTTPHFRLMGSGVTQKQRMLIAQAMALCFYLALGALIFIWIEGWTFSESLFFVMVTITTIGFGDRVPKTSGGLAFVVFYAAGGIVLFAMVVNAIRYVILEDLHQQFAVRSKDRKAQREARKQERKRKKALEKEHQQRVQAAIDHARQIGYLDSEEPHETPQEENSNTRQNSSRFSLLHRGVSTVLRGDLLSSLFVRQNSEDAKSKSSPMISPSSSPIIHIESSNGSQTSQAINGNAFSTAPRTTAERNPRLLGTAEDTPNQSSDFETFVDHEDPQAGSASHIANYVNDSISVIPDSGNAMTAQIRQPGRPWIRRIKLRFSRIIDALVRYSGLKRNSNRDDYGDNHHEESGNSEQRREIERRLAYEESMEEYRRRLRFSFAMFSCFWLIGAGIFHWTEDWDYGRSMYFTFVAFSSIGYGDMVPLSVAGRAIFLAYCFFGVVTLTTLAALISELLSKSIRRHVVEAQLRRNEMIVAHGGFRGERDTVQPDYDLEAGQGEVEDDTRDDHHERLQRLRNLTRSNPSQDEALFLDPDRSCEASLRNIIQVSKDFNTLLHSVLAPDSTRVENASKGSQRATSLPSTPPITMTSAQLHARAREQILDELEQEEDEDSPNYQSPSISRDIMASTSSIHRIASPISALAARFSHISQRQLKNNGNGCGGGVGGKGEAATFHSKGYHSPSLNSQIKITAWPKSDAESLTDSEGASASSSTRALPRTSYLPQTSASPTALSPISTKQPWLHVHNRDDSVTVPALQWQQLIEYSKRFQVLTDSCTRTLERLQEWEAKEKKRRRRRCQIRTKQNQILQRRRQRLDELCGTRGAVDDAIEDEEELEALQAWDEEGSTEEYDTEESSSGDEGDEENVGVARAGDLGSGRAGQGLRHNSIE